MTNWLTTENMKFYMEHLKKIDQEVEEQIQRDLRSEMKKKMTPQHINDRRQRKYLKYLVLPE